MLRSALALFSSLQVGLRIKQSIERLLRQAIVVAVAVVVLIAAAAFGLVAGYNALILSYGFSPTAAAGIVAGALVVLGLLILATLPLFEGKSKRAPSAHPMMAAGEGLGMLDQGVGQAMTQIGPVGLLSIAFLAGVLLSRKK